jgi:hypothetical protein
MSHTAASLTPAIEEHLRDFQHATSAIPTFRAQAGELTQHVRSLALWSVPHAPRVIHKPREAKEQASVSFVIASTDRVLWIAYPASKEGDPKLVFLVRAQKYLDATVVAEARARLVAMGVRSSLGGPREVLGVPLKALSTPSRLASTIQFLEWALTLPGLGASEA